MSLFSIVTQVLKDLLMSAGPLPEETISQENLVQKNLTRSLYDPMFVYRGTSMMGSFMHYEWENEPNRFF